MAATLRVWLLGLLCIGVWAFGGRPPPPAAPADAPPTEFSAGRAEEVLARLLGPEAPHPAGSGENAALHARLLAELARLGVPAQTLDGMSCAAHAVLATCAQVHDIVAEAVPGEGPAILLMAHLDSVAAGPGAADDGAGVATVLETIRALKAGAADHSKTHPVMALFSDGEEMGLLGAALFTKDDSWRGKVGVVINAEARGTSGPSYLFQTNPGGGKLAAIYGQGVAHPATSSLYGEIYKYLPNDTDLTPFLAAGVPGANFAFIGDVAAYHTPLDRRENLSPASLQSQGDNVLGLTRGLEAADFAALKNGDAIDLDVLRRWLPRLPASFALPLAVTVLALTLLASWYSPRNRLRLVVQTRRPLAVLLMPVLLLLGCIAAGFALSGFAAGLSGHGDPAFAHPLALRIALAFAAWALALLAMRVAGAMASWLWLALLGVASAIFAPGLSPYFTFPGLVAALLFLLTPERGRALALLLAALAAMAVWLPSAAGFESIMGLAAHPLLMAAFAFALIALLPVLAMQGMGENAWRISVALSLAVALIASAIAGLQPAYSATQPQRLNLRYVEKDGKAWMLADPVSPLPDALRAAAKFPDAPGPLVAWRGYAAPLGGIQFPAPSATVTRQGDRVLLDLHGSAAAGGMAVMTAGGIDGVRINDAAAAMQNGGIVTCGTPDCASARIELEFSGPAPSSLLLVEQRSGLPPNAAAIAKARPDWAAPSGQGDGTLIATDVAIPAD